ncbi:hypothetical protein OVA24_06340 [Luteolibacter sp. SL250]|uniref:hypothetical protein n=1 Tax=Luteolibacter sp. SL250 TaxID=2995170 RepID=UPI00226F3392|nr:hypothetical protein [Luteolibacter sp. SL250]WAC21000.1 hypothetical protein OVA24_06340 [Luteolibacter sp. SL250]
MKTTACFMVAAALLLVGCQDEAAQMEMESLKRENARLKESRARLLDEAKPVTEKDPGVDATPDIQSAHSLLSEQVSNGQWLSLCLEMALEVPEKDRSPKLQELVSYLHTAVVIYDAANDGIAQHVPPVLANPDTDPARLKMMNSQTATINEQTAEIHRLAAQLPKGN